MDVGPLRRLIGALGLVCLVPIAWLLATGAITLLDAAFRALITLVAVLVVGRVLGWFVEGLAVSVRDQGKGAPVDAAPRGERSTRRRDGEDEAGQDADAAVGS